jgi:hypothetical protein
MAANNEDISPTPELIEEQAQDTASEVLYSIFDNGQKWCIVLIASIAATCKS